MYIHIFVLIFTYLKKFIQPQTRSVSFYPSNTLILASDRSRPWPRFKLWLPKAKGNMPVLVQLGKTLALSQNDLFCKLKISENSPWFKISILNLNMQPWKRKQTHIHVTNLGGSTLILPVTCRFLPFLDLGLSGYGRHLPFIILRLKSLVAQS